MIAMRMSMKVREQQEKRIPTQWENMEKMLQAESAKYTPQQLKEWFERWDGE